MLSTIPTIVFQHYVHPLHNRYGYNSPSYTESIKRCDQKLDDVTIVHNTLIKSVGQG